MQVKAGKPLKVRPDEDCLIHLSQACIGNRKKGETALMYVALMGRSLTLSQEEKIPQVSFDLVFEKEFELSHSLVDSSSSEDYSSSDSEEEEEVEVPSTALPIAGAAASSVVKADSKPEEVNRESDEDDEGSDKKVPWLGQSVP
ncbi:LOW QUALITY PROTEIN: hypothetical protein HID58_013557, partial [Brassica napus]